ncbi:MAG: ATP synthase subunit I [Nitrospirota bacterium]
MNLLIKRIYKQAIIILLPISIISAFIEWKRLPISILIGGTLGLANLRGLARGVEGLIRTQRPTAAIIFFSLLRLSILAFILIILIIYKLINIFGVLIGFTVVFIVILIEGLKVAKEL